MKRIPKPVFFIVALLVLAFTFTAVFGVSYYTEGRFGYTKCVTPICKKCNDRFKNNQAWKVFKVRGYHLCQVPNKPPKR